MKKYAAFLLPLLAAGAPAAGEELGRLFYTPQQRLQLDYREASSGQGDGGGRGYVIVNGVVQKQGGKRTVWINGVPQPAERANDNSPASISVTVPGKKHPVRAKVGERILLEPPAQQETK